jgi:zinc transport system permease protein
MSAVVDPLFQVPLLAGLAVAILLSLLGPLLRLRDEWLAALGIAQLGAASGLIGIALGLPILLTAPIGAMGGAVAKQWLSRRGNTAYAVMLLLGWCSTLLVAANTRLGDSLAHALVDGQLYFAGTDHLIAVTCALVAALGLLPWLMPRLLRARFFPEFERANGLPAWRWHLGFDLLAALTLAFGTTTVGLMASFALVLVPPWIAFRFAGSWRGTLLLSAGLGTLAYLLAFAVALGLDQPFGPILVAVLLGLALIARFVADLLGHPTPS